MVINEQHVSDFSFADYTARQRRDVSSHQIDLRAKTVKPSGNFTYRTDRGWHPNEYTGFAVISMIKNNPLNTFLGFQLHEIQNELHENLDDNEAYYMLPQDSFHQTVANTLSNAAFKQKIEMRGLEPDYAHIIEDAFEQIPGSLEDNPIKMKLVGLSIFGTAIGILGVFESEKDYERITNFRKQFYANPSLNNLGIHMTRPFIGHITLAYIERELQSIERLHLAAVVADINKHLIDNPLNFFIARTELRRYYNLAEFIRKDHFPVFLF
jgi:hypothetical protein